MENEKNFSVNRNVDIKLYKTKKWADIRESILLETPFCVVCNNTRRLHIDHIWEHNNIEDLFYLKENLQPLCFQCHRTKTFFDKYILNLKSGNDVLYVYDEINELASSPLLQRNNYLRIKNIINSTIDSNEFLTYKLNIKNLTLSEIYEIIYGMIRRIKFSFKKIIYNDQEFVKLNEFGVCLLNKRKTA